jgi:hypothetical protein
MRRTIKRTLIVTSTETWTISFECRVPGESWKTEEAPALIIDDMTTIGDDLPPQQYAQREAEDVQSVDVAHSTDEERQD